MSLETCAEIVRQGDPDRFLATMAAPVALRPRLFALFALNLQVARAPWVSPEPLVCEMRLQWWHDGVEAIGEGRPAPRHDVFDALDGALGARDAQILLELIAARRGDIARTGFSDNAELARYLQATSGGLMWVAARLCGTRDDDARAEAAVREIGQASGLAGWFMAVPALVARGWSPLPDPDPEAISALARDALARLRAARRRVPAVARPATRTGWRAQKTLSLAAANPAAVIGGSLHISEFSRKLSLLVRVLSGSP